MTELTPLVGIAEVARILSVSKITVRRLVGVGELRCIRLSAGGPLRFDLADVQRFIASKKQ